MVRKSQKQVTENEEIQEEVENITEIDTGTSLCEEINEPQDNI